jgi:hypothetical protein
MMNDLPERFAAFIESEGHAVTIERFGENERGANLVFRSTGKIYKVRIDRTDDGFFALTIGYSIGYPTPREVLVDAALETAHAFKAAKIDVGETGFEAAVELFFAGPDGYKPLFWRSVHVATQAANDFMSRVDAKRPSEPDVDARIAAERFVAEFTRGRGTAE